MAGEVDAADEREREERRDHELADDILDAMKAGHRPLLAFQADRVHDGVRERHAERDHDRGDVDGEDDFPEHDGEDHAPNLRCGAAFSCRARRGAHGLTTMIAIVASASRDVAEPKRVSRRVAARYSSPGANSPPAKVSRSRRAACSARLAAGIRTEPAR